MGYHKKGYVKFDRKIKDWGWYTDVKTFKLFFHLVMYANFTDGFFLGVPIKRGQLAKSVEHLAAETGLTCSEVRTAIKHLESTGEITSKGHAKFTVFSVVNYDLYQTEQRAFNEHLTNDLANDSQTFNERLTNNSQQYKNDKNDKNDKNAYYTRGRARNKNYSSGSCDAESDIEAAEKLRKLNEQKRQRGKTANGT